MSKVLTLLPQVRRRKMAYKNTVITGTGAYVPTEATPNAHFAERQFFNIDQTAVANGGAEVIEKFETITGIAERRYVTPDLTASEIGASAAKAAIADAGCDPETIDQIIVAHNYGDIEHGSIQSDTVPCIAARIKNILGIKNPACVAYDVLFGCPGWLQGVIQAEAFMRSGQAKKCLVIGTETLSRVVDPHDRDSMIYSDGAGATLIELKEEDRKRGILTFGTKSYCNEEAFYLFFGRSNRPDSSEDTRYIKMHGRKIYEFALNEVPTAMKECLDASGHGADELKKIFIHQANEKMDDAIVKRFFRLYNIRQAPEGIMPMSIHSLGNSSVATVPTLFHLVKSGKKENHHIAPGDLIMFASVGGGMHINAVTYIV